MLHESLLPISYLYECNDCNRQSYFDLFIAMNTHSLYKFKIYMYSVVTTNLYAEVGKVTVPLLLSYVIS
jgi:hypothetical protein